MFVVRMSQVAYHEIPVGPWEYILFEMIEGTSWRTLVTQIIGESLLRFTPVFEFGKQ